MLARLEERAERPRYLVLDANGWSPVTWREHAQQIEGVAAFCTSWGLQPGDRVAIFADNRVEWMAAALGIQAAGGVAVPIYPGSTADQATYVLGHGQCRLVLVDDPARLERVLAPGASLPELSAAVMLDPRARVPETAELVVRSWAEVMDEGRAHDGRAPERLAARLERLDPHQPALMLYTSGTTGRPKGVPLTHANLAINWSDWMRSNAPLIEEHAVDLLWLPMSHVFGYGEAHTGNTLGFTSYLCDPGSVLGLLPELRPSVFLSVPAYWEKLATLAMAHDGPEDRVRALLEATGGRLRFCLSGGARLRPEIKALFHQAGIRLLEGYGLTECSPTLTVERPDAGRIDSVGQPLPSVELRIADDGEIQARGPGVFGGYHRDPEATAAAFTPDGWFRTGDLGRLTEDGSLRLTGRRKEILVTSGGKNVPPVDIETRLCAHPWVLHAMVYGDGKKFLTAGIWLDHERIEHDLGARGLPRPQHAEAVRAAVAQAVEQVNAELARFEQIKRFCVMERPLSVEGGHLTTTLKLRRHHIQAAFHDELEALYAEGTPR
ncbi:MAG: long-chain fatty acid--CoA ligase [Myxococcales bacterium]|nr:long-chain fatty acid--CoA ligase [Myxococcales bacterium]MCB9712233.1 long-chain fatty acid--CoA ligase [Myxococcales bacterium]